MNSVRIAIVGAGITGLTTALTLAKAGCEGVAVFEAAQSFEEVGAGIAIGGNAVRVLQHIGVDPARFGHVPPALEFREWSQAKVLSCTEIGRRYTHDIGAPYLTFHRATLQHGLVQRIEQMGVDVSLGRRLQSINVGDADRHAVLHFESGESINAEIVIAADGIRSVARSFIDPEVKPRYSGEIAFRGLVPIDRVPGYPSPENISIWCGPKTHAVNYAIDDGKLINLFAVFQPDALPAWTVQSNRMLGERSKAVEDFRARGWSSAIVDLIETSEGDLHYWALMDLPPLKTWSRGRVVLAGDAAHGPLPHQGMGGGMGIESGYAIGAMLGARGTQEFAHIFEAYERLRKPRATKVQVWSRLAGQADKLADAQRVRQRNETLWRVGDNIRWIHAYDVIRVVEQWVESPAQRAGLAQSAREEVLASYLQRNFNLRIDGLDYSVKLADLGLGSLDVVELLLELDMADVGGRFKVGADCTLGEVLTIAFAQAD